jgi:hypothetical protein
MTATSMFNTGFLKSPAEHITSATPFLAATTPIPPLFAADITALPVLMQGQQPACVAHAVCYSMMYEIWKQTGQVVQLSPRFLYALCKANDGVPNEEGTFTSVALAMAKKYGVCTEEAFPNDVTLSMADYKDITKIPEAAYTNALQYMVEDFSPIMNLSLESLEDAINQNQLVIAGLEVSDSWWTSTDGTTTWTASDILPLRPPSPSNPSVSGHCINFYTYNTSINLIGLINEWSTEWGNQGSAFFYPNYLPDIYEAWIIKGVKVVN